MKKNKIKFLSYIESLNRLSLLIECRVEDDEHDDLVTRKILQITIYSVKDANTLLQFLQSELQARDRVIQHNKESWKVMESLQKEVNCVREDNECRKNQMIYKT